MEVKKTEKASLKGSNMLYFLIGLNVVLVTVLLMFNYRQVEKAPVVQEEPEVVELTEAVLIDIPEPETPPPPPPADEPPPPPPPEIPTVVEETPEEVPPPPIQKQDEVRKIDVPTGPVSKGPVKKVDLSGLKQETKEAPKEERVAEPVTVNRVEYMAVYPGCEKFKGQKSKLIKCFGDQLQEDILRFLDTEYPESAENKKQVVVALEFHVDPNGYITNVNPKGGDSEFKPEAKRALEATSEWLKRKNKKIEPAKMKDGSTATLIFGTRVGLANPDY